MIYVHIISIHHINNLDTNVIIKPKHIFKQINKMKYNSIIKIIIHLIGIIIIILNQFPKIIAHMGAYMEASKPK